MPSSKKKLPRKAADKLRRVDIENCKFAFQCSAKWGDLKPTADTGVRHCGACKKDVYFCETDCEVRSAIKGGLCIAIRRPLRAADFGDQFILGLPIGQDLFEA